MMLMTQSQVMIQIILIINKKLYNKTEEAKPAVGGESSVFSLSKVEEEINDENN